MSFKDLHPQAQLFVLAKTLQLVESQLAKTEDDPYGYEGWQEIKQSPWKRRAFGGVVFNDQGQVLIRKPSNGFGGYTWTWPKGKLDSETEHPLQTALREVGEETGYDAEPVSYLPGTFRSDGHSTNNFWLMRHNGKPPRPTDWETEEVKWAHPEEARKLLALSPNEPGRKRDLAILDAALAHWGKR